jgi:hypothetical protein
MPIGQEISQKFGPGHHLRLASPVWVLTLAFCLLHQITDEAKKEDDAIASPWGETMAIVLSLKHGVEPVLLVVAVLEVFFVLLPLLILQLMQRIL